MNEEENNFDNNVPENNENYDVVEQVNEDTTENIEIVNGDGTNLDISKVYDHISTETPSENEKPKDNVVIPGGIKQAPDNNNIENRPPKPFAYDDYESSYYEDFDPTKFEPFDSNRMD